MRKPKYKNPTLNYPNGDRIIEVFCFPTITIKSDDTLVFTVKKLRPYGEGPKIIEKQYSGQQVIDETALLDDEQRELYKNYLTVDLSEEERALLGAGEYKYDWAIIDRDGNRLTPAEPGDLIIKKVVHDV